MHPLVQAALLYGVYQLLHLDQYSHDSTAATTNEGTKYLEATEVAGENKARGGDSSTTCISLGSNSVHPSGRLLVRPLPRVEHT